MIQLIEYAVRVKGTQKYLVRSQRRDGRGGSHLEPVDFSLPKEQRLPPEKARYLPEMQIRTYATYKAAKNLLTTWCQGRFVGRDWDPDCGYTYSEPEKSTQRDPNKLEIVELIITLPE